MDKQQKMPLVEALIEYKNKGGTSFHIPGHSNGAGVALRFAEAVGMEVLRCDATEIKGLDDYHKAEGAIAEAQCLAADAWGSEKALFLVNGTTSGVMAAITSIAREGDEVIVQRNSHKSAQRGLIMCGATPVYAAPELCSETGFAGSVSPEEIKSLLEMHNKVKAVFITNPTYYGVYSDLRSIIETAHSKGVPVIVDEAHGGHVYFCDGYPDGAVTLGADIVIQSTHKTVGSMTQSSIIHYGGNLVEARRLEENVKLLQSTSPSYILMASLDAARYNMAVNGKRLLSERLEMCKACGDELNSIPGIKCLPSEKGRLDHVFDTEKLRLVITAEGCGLSGIELADILCDQHKIDVEFADARYIIGLVGPGTSKDDVLALLEALRKVSDMFYGKKEPLSNHSQLAAGCAVLPVMARTPRQAHFERVVEANWDDCKGRAAANDITPYPPGVPLVIKGEVISAEMHGYISELLKLGIHIHGLENRGNKWHSYILDIVL